MVELDALYGSLLPGKVSKRDLLRWYESGTQGHVPTHPVWWPKQTDLLSYEHIARLAPRHAEAHADVIWIATCCCWPTIAMTWIRWLCYAYRDILRIDTSVLLAPIALDKHPDWARSVLRAPDTVERRICLQSINAIFDDQPSVVLQATYRACMREYGSETLAWMRSMVADTYLVSSPMSTMRPK